ncbi:Hypothetical protein UVM_LOCUS7 [uncultured virus]|nr:Hypothetical protein UVM_LOCUS7 [uncultured virus]
MPREHDKITFECGCVTHDQWEVYAPGRVGELSRHTVFCTAHAGSGGGSEGESDSGGVAALRRGREAVARQVEYELALDRAKLRAKAAKLGAKSATLQAKAEALGALKAALGWTE